MCQAMPSKEELRDANMVKPKFMPSHANTAYKISLQLAGQIGIPKEKILSLEDGMVLEINGNGAATRGKVNSAVYS